MSFCTGDKGIRNEVAEYQLARLSWLEHSICMAEARPPDEHPRVYTPATLAKRWHCSERHIRNMIKNGNLGAFWLGGKLVRIPVAEVVRIEATPAVDAPESDTRFHAEETKPAQRVKRLDVITRAKIQELRKRGTMT